MRRALLLLLEMVGPAGCRLPASAFELIVRHCLSNQCEPDVLHGGEFRSHVDIAGAWHAIPSGEIFACHIGGTNTFLVPQIRLC